MLKLKIITPKKVVLEDEIISATIPTDDGEITILEKHVPLFSLIKEGIIKIKKQDDEDFFAIGGGYLETDGKELVILVSRAYGQDEIDEKMILEAQEQAKKILANPSSEKERQEAIALMKRAIIDSKLIKKKKAKTI